MSYDQGTLAVTLAVDCKTPPWGTCTHRLPTITSIPEATTGVPRGGSRRKIGDLDPMGRMLCKGWLAPNTPYAHASHRRRLLCTLCKGSIG